MKPPRETDCAAVNSCGAGSEEAASRLQRGELIACPTEAVWGISCDPFNEAAVLRVLRLKRRPVEKGLLLLAAGMDQIEDLLAPLAPQQIAELRESWPGPVTWLIPDPDKRYPGWVKGKHPSVAIRVSDHPVAAAISRSFGKPMVSTSANLAGEPEIRSRQDLRRQFGDRIHCIVKGELGGRDAPSEIRDLSSGRRIR